MTRQRHGGMRFRETTFGDWVVAWFLAVVILTVVSVLVLVGTFAVFLTIRLIGMMP